jgi:hypothetical protein
MIHEKDITTQQIIRIITEHFDIWEHDDKLQQEDDVILRERDYSNKRYTGITITAKVKFIIPYNGYDGILLKDINCKTDNTLASSPITSKGEIG